MILQIFLDFSSIYDTFLNVLMMQLLSRRHFDHDFAPQIQRAERPGDGNGTRIRPIARKN